MFTRAPRFGTFRTIVLGPQESSIQNSGSCWQNVVPGHEVPVAIESGSSTTLFEKNVISLLQEVCYTANSCQPCSPGHQNLVPFER